MTSSADVLRVADTGAEPIVALLRKYGLQLQMTADQESIPGSFWGEPEAGIIGKSVFVRGDTPIHSVLHETCHLICTSGERRDTLHGNAGSDDLEESAVCFLQIVLSDWVPDFGRERMMRDMDAWGYSFRYGSSTVWFSEDAADARSWLVSHGIIDGNTEPSWTLRE